MTGEQFEKECRVKHYTDLAGQAQEDRRKSERRLANPLSLDGDDDRRDNDRRKGY